MNRSRFGRKSGIKREIWRTWEVRKEACSEVVKKRKEDVVRVVGDFLSPVLKFHLFEVVSKLFEILDDLTKLDKLLSEVIDWMRSIFFETDVNDASRDVIDWSEIEVNVVLLFRILPSDKDGFQEAVHVVAFAAGSCDTVSWKRSQVDNIIS